MTHEHDWSSNYIKNIWINLKKKNKYFILFYLNCFKTLLYKVTKEQECTPAYSVNSTRWLYTYMYQRTGVDASVQCELNTLILDVHVPRILYS